MATTSFTVLHLADIHIRDNARDNFYAALDRFKTFLSNTQRTSAPNDHVLAVIAGDIFHYKTRLSAENITDCYALLDTLAQYVSDIIIIPGNHDANVNNEERIDLLTPILANSRALTNNCVLRYWPHSGWQAPLYNCLQFHVFSPLDEYKAPLVPPNARFTNIALVHDFVDGLRIQGSYGRSELKQEWLAPFHCVMCGHSHDYQSFRLANGAPMAYSGALTQLTIGESFDKGFVVWTLSPGREITQRFVRLDIPRAQVKYVVTQSEGARGGNNIRIAVNRAVPCAKTDDQLACPCDAARVVIESRVKMNVAQRDSPEIRNLIDSILRVMPNIAIEYVASAERVANEVSQRVAEGSTVNMQDTLITAKLRAANPRIDAETVASVITLHHEMLRAQLDAPTDASTRDVVCKWTLKYLAWDDLFCYGAGNHINFSETTGLAGLIAPNRCGKSSVIDILALALFNRTLRGSAISIIRRGMREGSLRCIWTTRATSRDEETHQHELRRKWDLRGHTTISYSIDERNCTGVDLKATYAQIERSVGTIDDFIAAVLIPQHSEMSPFLDATDLQRRAIIARILGLDVFDAILCATKDRERKHNAAIRGYASVIESTSAPQDMMDPEKRMSALSAEIASSRDAIHALKTRLESLETIAPVCKPARDVADIEREIRALSSRIAEHEGTERTIRARITDTHAQLSALRGTNAPTLGAQLDADRAKLVALTGRLDQKFLMMGRAKGTRLEDVPAQMAAAQTKLGALLKARTLRAEQLELEKAIIADTDIKKRYDDASAVFEELTKTANHTCAKDGEAADTAAQCAGSLPSEQTIPRACRCGDMNTTPAERAQLLIELARASFASGILACEVPAEIQTQNSHECVARMRKLVCLDEKPDKQRALELAQCAVQFAHIVAFDPNACADTHQARAQYESAKYCAQWHDKIARNNAARAKVEMEKLRDEYGRAQERATRRDAIERELQSLLSVCLRHISHCKYKNPTIEFLNDQIYACERALALLSELHANRDKISEALAIDAEIMELRAQIDTNFNIQRLMLALDGDEKTCASLRARIDEVTANIAKLRAEIEPTNEAQKEYDAFIARQGEIKKLRDNYARAQVAHLALVADANEYGRVRESLKAAHANIAREHKDLHICQLYKMALDAKTGIQYNLMERAMELIENEANRILEPIAKLRLSMRLGMANTAVNIVGMAAASSDGNPLVTAACATSSPSANIPHLASGSSKTMVIAVRDATTGLEHPAELCSGFQRFILNIALRRAFLRAAVRPMPQFMIIDEGFGCLDEANMARVSEYMPDLARELQFMLIVSHIDALNTMITAPMVIDTKNYTSALSQLRVGTALDITLLEPASTAPHPAKRARKRATETGGESPASAGAKKINAQIDPEIVDQRQDGTMFCKICGSDFAIWARHARSKKHVQKMINRHS